MPRVLVIEDDDNARPALVLLLQRELACEIDAVASGGEALAAMLDHGYDVMITDVSMFRARPSWPTASLGLADIIRAARSVNKGILVVLISGFAGRDLASIAWAVAAPVWLEKPVDAKRLADIIRDYLRKVG